MKTKPYLVHALSPLHAGTGHAADIIDLPTVRMKATGIPFVPGSTIKGVLREAYRTNPSPRLEAEEAIFGPARNPEAHAGALVVGDARLLALPVRSFKGTFAWVTSPLLLTLAERDLDAAKRSIPQFSTRSAKVTSDPVCLHEDKIYLEDLDLSASKSGEADSWARYLKAYVAPTEDIFSKRFVIVDDDTMTFLWETATQVDARVRIDERTRTVAQGALWLEESLPPETLLIGILAADRSRRTGLAMSPDEVLVSVLSETRVLQLGGKASTGRGRCRVVPIESAQ